MLTDEEKKTLKDANPGVDLYFIENETVAPGITFVVKCPSDASWKRFQAERENDEQKSTAIRRLVLTHVIKPTANDLLSMLQAQPGLVESLGGPLIKIAGASAASTFGKI